MIVIKKFVHVMATICYFLIGIYISVMVPELLGYKPLVVLSGSMEPTFKTGSVIYYKSVESKELKEGDIITFKIEDTYISHRINKIKNDLIETKGDANDTPDQKLIGFDQVVGRDLNIYIPYIGYYLNFINNNLYLVGVLILILISEFILINLKNDEGKR